MIIFYFTLLSIALAQMAVSAAIIVTLRRMQ